MAAVVEAPAVEALGVKVAAVETAAVESGAVKAATVAPAAKAPTDVPEDAPVILKAAQQALFHCTTMTDGVSSPAAHAVAIASGQEFLAVHA